MSSLTKGFTVKRKLGLGFIALAILFSCWGWGVNGGFHESDELPNYSMAARSMMGGALEIQEPCTLDLLNVDGRKFLYSGPVPALIRIPFMAVTGADGIPTGLMIALFTAGICVFFFACLNLLATEDSEKLLLCKAIFMAVLILCGYTLYMASLHSFHNEAICAAMCFLMASVFLLLKHHKEQFQLPVFHSFLFGLSVFLCILTRFSYVFSACALCGLFIFGLWKNRDMIPRDKLITSTAIVSVMLAAALVWAMLYNFMRFGEFLEFGMKFQETWYHSYYEANGFLKYDHIPNNLWAIFFKLPELSGGFPFIKLTSYLTTSLTHTPPVQNYKMLLFSNEISASIFVLMPITIFAFTPMIFHGLAGKSRINRKYGILFMLLALQIAPIAMTVNTVARFYFDFLPILLMMSFVGVAGSGLGKKDMELTTAAFGVASLLLSFAVLMNAFAFHGYGRWGG